MFLFVHIMLIVNEAFVRAFKCHLKKIRALESLLKKTTISNPKKLANEGTHGVLIL